jgi:hypothetical protein
VLKIIVGLTTKVTIDFLAKNKVCNVKLAEKTALKSDPQTTKKNRR